MNTYFKDYKIRAYAKDFITCLRIMKTKEGRYIERQIAISTRAIRSISEIQHPELGRGIRIDIGDGDIPDNIDCYGADMKTAAVAVNSAQKGFPEK